MDGKARKILPFVKQKSEKVRSPLHMIKTQCCTVCGAYGCTGKIVTDKSNEPTDTGDNLIPLCKNHIRCSIQELFNTYPVIRAWLQEHERFDIVMKLDGYY